jgi:adenylate cyclase
MEMQKMFRKMSGKGNRLLNCVGISVNAGLVVSGNIGSQSKMEYTVIGDTVNMASRMNTLAKANEIIISKAIFEKLRNNLHTVALPPAVIKGKSELVQTYKVLAFHE